MEPEWLKESRERQRHDQERRQDKQDEERRHRERLKAMNASSSTNLFHKVMNATSSPNPNYATDSGVSGGSFKFLATCVVLLLAAYGGWTLLTERQSVPGERPALEPITDEPAAGMTLEADEMQAAAPPLEQRQVAEANEAQLTDHNPRSENAASSTVDQREDATLSALRSGTRVEWQDASGTGYVMVSAPITVSAGICRSVSYLNLDGSPTGPAETWCSDAKGLWKKR